MRSICQKLLSFSLLTSILTSFVACGTNNILDSQDTISNEYVTETTTPDPNYICELPASVNYDTEINYLYTDMSGRADELSSAGLGGGVISDAVYERNIAVSNRLGVELCFSSRESDIETTSAIAHLVQSGDKSIDIFVTGTYVCMTPTTAGHYLNLNDIENLDLSKHYWNQYYNEMMTFTSDNLQFVATSPTAISIFRKGYLTIFNRDILAEYQMPNLYEVIEKGDWTLDYQHTLIKDIYTDSNGDGQRDADDFYGFMVGNVTDMDVYAVSSNIHLVVRDESGDMLYHSDDFERLVDMSEKVSSLCNATGTYLADSFSEGFHKPIEQFAKEKVLMATTMFGSIESQIEFLADISYGIAPIPKLYKEQAQYGTYIQDQVSSFGISAALGDMDRQAIVGAVMEAMSYYSYLLVRPAYYDSVLSLRFMQDPQSRDILDTMFESISFDYVYATGLGDVRDGMRALICSSSPSIASKSKVWQRKIEFALQNQKDAFDKLQNSNI